MTLKTGDSLQNSKYVVQSVLDQSDFGITYSAKHTLLEQFVLLQTFNEVVGQRSDIAQLRQQFFTKARSLAQRSDSLQVLDCFEENTLPYIVLQKTSITSRLSDWLTLPPEPSNSAPPEAAKLEAAKPEASKPEPPKLEAQTPETPDPPTPPEISIAPERRHEIGLPQLNSTLSNSTSSSSTSKNSTTGQSPQIIQPRRIPIPFLVTLLVGLGLGAGAGFALRFQPTRVTGQTPSLFGQEQTFPAQGDWPISETPDRLTVEPKLEEPIYRTNVPDYYSPTPQPYSPKTNLDNPPSASYPSPEAKADRPLEKSPSPSPLDEFSSPASPKQAIDAAPLPPLNNFDSLPNIQPATTPANPAPIPSSAPERSPKVFKPPAIRQ